MRDLMYEMITSSHVHALAMNRDNDWTVPFLDSWKKLQTSNITTTKTMISPHNNNSNILFLQQQQQQQTNESKSDKTQKPTDTNDNGDDNNENSEKKTSSDSEPAEESSSDYENDNFDGYELPDGTRIDISSSHPNGNDLCRIPELLFANHNDLPFLSEYTLSTPSHHHMSTLSSLPIHELAKASLTAVGDADVRKELCGNIILTGASSLFENLERRLSVELANVIPSSYRCKVIATRNTIERRYASWIGGSVLSSLGSFQQLWLSRAEYDEYGVLLASQRFP